MNCHCGLYPLSPAGIYEGEGGSVHTARACTPAPGGKLPDRPRRVDVLCQCGWGRLAILESEVPDYCPLCGFSFNPMEDE